MNTVVLALAAAELALAPSIVPPTPVPTAGQEEAATPLSPGEIVAAAPESEWVRIAPEDLLVMTLAPDADGDPREVVIQLMPAPYGEGWVGNIRTLARERWYDGIAVTRVQDNYVVQWGDPNAEDESAAKPLPAGLRTMKEADYVVPFGQTRPRQRVVIMSDPYSDMAFYEAGWPLATRDGNAWPVHCYGMVGVGRGYSPDTGSGAELYTVIGHAPRHLDRNIAVVGRVVEGIEHLSSLPRGTGPLGFYEDPAQNVPIISIRVASDLPESERPRFEYLSTEGATFERYVQARTNRRDPFFITPARGIDVCNAPVPVRRVADGG
ncbi:peptidylprolyl isomerase [Pelagerythrobacter aerophilus]|uniref:peptidylprolyl isomerase n=1 Tax=Pelagerythrobacter aerophilus TaxID=2306995 RepID=A0A418NG14_9SPHN|nr:peptidylprolyl isomerase [Pelagerythrobacter aerophilus]RIV77019.1 peptidylprolyl isomerase [Pelagerythrobacter aerophilus]